MSKKDIGPSIWRTARVETATLALLMAAIAIATALGWMRNVNPSLAVLAVYAVWIAICASIYRFFYRLDT